MLLNLTQAKRTNTCSRLQSFPCILPPLTWRFRVPSSNLPKNALPWKGYHCLHMAWIHPAHCPAGLSPVHMGPFCHFRVTSCTQQDLPSRGGSSLQNCCAHLVKWQRNPNLFVSFCTPPYLENGWTYRFPCFTVR